MPEEVVVTPTLDDNVECGGSIQQEVGEVVVDDIKAQDLEEEKHLDKNIVSMDERESNL